MNVFVNRREGDRRYTLFDPRVDLFRAGMTRHRLHDLVENLTLVGRGEPMIRAKFTERTSRDVGRVLHQELVNDNYSCSSNGQDSELKRVCASGHLMQGTTRIHHIETTDHRNSSWVRDIFQDPDRICESADFSCPLK